MSFPLYIPSESGAPRRLRIAGAALLTTSLVAIHATPALADITNDATASGSYGATTVTSPQDSEAVPVAPATPTMTILKTVATPTDTNSDGIIGAGDTITYTYTVTNTGNVTITGVSPVDAGPTFNNIAGTNTLSAFSPASATLTPTGPSSTQIFTATYTMSATDAINAAGIPAATGDAIENSATATGTPARGTLGTVAPSTAETEIPGASNLVIAKAWAFAPGGDVNSNGLADTGDQIIYTYTVSNTGNTTITNVTVNDVHEGTALSAGTVANETIVTQGPVGTSTDAANNGSWDTLTAGSVISFTYTHTVTLTEFNDG
jgi:uncharacterized repeat protein (TIGR01451 family)